MMIMMRATAREQRRQRPQVFLIIAAATFASIVFGPPAVVSSLKLKNNTTCEILTFIPFTDSREGLGGDHHANNSSRELYGYGNWPNAESLAKAGYSLMAAAEMARRHFNERNDVIVSDLKFLTLDCDVRLGHPSQAGYVDSAYDRHEAMRQLVEVKATEVLRGGQAEDALCAVVGPVEDYAVEGVAALTETMHIPHLSYASVSQRLTHKDIYPDLVRVIPSANDIATRLARYIQRDIWHREYVGVIYDESEFGEQYLIALEDVEAEVGYELVKEHYIEGNNETIEHALEEVEEAGYKTIVFVTDRGAVLEHVADLAQEKGMLDGSVFWILSGHAITPAFLQSSRHKTGSPMDKLLRGAAVFANHDPFMYYGEEDPFLKAWREQDGAFVEELNSLQPHSMTTGRRHYVAPPTYFQTETPAEFASFLYDAVMATGIGACKAASQNSNTTHLVQVLGSEFSGASGPIRFTSTGEHGAATSGRDASDVDFGIYNVRAVAAATDGTEDDMTSYEAVLTSIYSDRNTYVDAKTGERLPGAWVNVDGTEFIFSDGSSEEPLPKRAVSDHHHLSDAVRTVGFFLVALSLFVCVFSSGWVYYFRNHHLVKVSQPEFLWLLCFGAALVGCSVVFISFDEGKGWSKAELDGACSAFPWFFVVGYLTMYCALFCKLWRLSKLMQMRRRAVRVHQVFLPFVLIITSSLIVLIVWQVLDPLSWVVQVVSDDPLETFGQCASAKHGLIPFIVPLGLLFAIIMILTAVIAWQLRDVQAELSESRWIFFGILTHLQTWAVGIPIIVITNNVSKDAFYVMLAALSFIFSSSLVALVIWPKIYSWVLLRYAPAHGRKQGGTSTQITIGSHSGTTRVSGLVTHSTTASNGSQFITGGIRSGGISKAEADEYKEKIAMLECQVRLLSEQIRAAKDEKNAKEETTTTTAREEKTEETVVPMEQARVVQPVEQARLPPGTSDENNAAPRSGQPPAIVPPPAQSIQAMRETQPPGGVNDAAPETAHDQRGVPATTTSDGVKPLITSSTNPVVTSSPPSQESSSAVVFEEDRRAVEEDSGDEMEV